MKADGAVNMQAEAGEVMMAQVKQGALLLVRLALAFGAMVLAYMVSTLALRGVDVAMTPEQAQQATQGLVWLALAFALVLSFLVLHARWYGVRLMGAIFIVFFGVETFLAQIETLYFNDALQMEMVLIFAIVAAGAVRAALFSMLVVPIFGKWRSPAQDAADPTPPLPPHWRLRFLALSGFYVVVYLLFGYFVAWQAEAVRLYYTGSTAIDPFFVHMRNLVVTDDPFLLLLQFGRGALWTALALLIVRMLAARRWEVALAVGLTFAVLLALPLLLLPNPYMPPPVARAHFYEIASSMLLFGGVAGWVLYASPSLQVTKRGPAPQHSPLTRSRL